MSPLDGEAAHQRHQASQQTKLFLPRHDWRKHLTLRLSASDALASNVKVSAFTLNANEFAAHLSCCHACRTTAHEWVKNSFAAVCKCLHPVSNQTKWFLRWMLSLLYWYVPNGVMTATVPTLLPWPVQDCNRLPACAWTITRKLRRSIGFNPNAKPYQRKPRSLQRGRVLPFAGHHNPPRSLLNKHRRQMPQCVRVYGIEINGSRIKAVCRARTFVRDVAIRRISDDRINLGQCRQDFAAVAVPKLGVTNDDFFRQRHRSHPSPRSGPGTAWHCSDSVGGSCGCTRHHPASGSRMSHRCANAHSCWEHL